jgi:hypothetical protein
MTEALETTREADTSGSRLSRHCRRWNDVLLVSETLRQHPAPICTSFPQRTPSASASGPSTLSGRRGSPMHRPVTRYLTRTAKVSYALPWHSSLACFPTTGNGGRAPVSHQANGGDVFLPGA